MIIIIIINIIIIMIIIIIINIIIIIIIIIIINNIIMIMRCPLANGGSTLDICTNHCGSSLPQTNKRGYACYCDDSCQKYGDCCPGHQVECHAPSPLPDIATAVFGPANWVTDLIEKSEKDALMCGNTQFYWPF